MMNEYTGDMAERKSVQVPILSRTVTTELTGDFSLPDYQPEIKRLLRIETNVLPPNRFAGGDGVELSGTLDYYVLYMGHDNAVYCAPLSTEYRMTAEPDAEEKGLMAAAGEPLVCLCDAVAETPTGRVTAPRRLNIRCKIKADVKLYGECRMQGDGEEDTSVETLPGETSVNRLYWGMGETLPLQEDVILSPTEQEWRVVCAEGHVMMTDATPGMGFVSCRGEVTLKLTLCPAETAEEFASDTTDGRSAPPLTVMQRKIPFTQSVEVAGITPACSATACGYCTDISVEMENGHAHVEMGVVTEARGQKNETVSYVKDLFSTRRESACRYTTYPAEAAMKALNGNFTLSDSLPLSEVGIDSSARVVDVTAVATPESLTADAAKGRCVLTGTCACHLLLLRDGEYTSADMTLPFRYEFDVQADGAMDELTGFDGNLSVVNCRARMDGERVGVDAEVAVSLRTYRSAPLTALSDVDFGEEVTRRRGEYVICFPAPTDSAWSVAKRYHAPMAALTAANNLPAGAKADGEESLEGIGYLIV